MKAVLLPENLIHGYPESIYAESKHGTLRPVLRVFNTLTGQIEEFQPLSPPNVKMYVCGPTVYDDAHIGHGRVYTVYDAVLRYLLFSGFHVKYVRNVTDVDDKIIKKAQAQGVEFTEIAKKFTASFHEDMKSLGLLEPDEEPRASETIPEIIEMIETLIQKGKAYASDGDVYFSISEIQNYGKLSGKTIEDLEAGARVAPGEKKKDPLDFALWKAAKPGEPYWGSPWGQGRPGWHIECSAMNKKILGESIDIHTGGRDLIFPHHENEIAQSEGANDKPFAKYWLHNGFVNIDKEKMSKSLGNIITLKKLLEKFHPEALKFYLFSSHYRSPMDFSDTQVEEAARGLDRLYRVLLSVPAGKSKELHPETEKAFREAMDDDFNTAKALGVLFDAAKEANRLQRKTETLGEATNLRDSIVKLGNVMGLLTSEAKEYFQNRPGMGDVDIPKVEELIAERATSRREKNFDRADQIRNELTALGIALDDTPEGTQWRKA